MSSRSAFCHTTRPCTRSSITVSPSSGALRRMTGLTPGGASLGSRSRQGLWIVCGPSEALLRLRQLALRRMARAWPRSRPAQIAVVGLAGGEQLLGHLAVALGAGELVERLAVPVELEPLEPVEDGCDGGLGGALAVGVLDAQQEFAAGVAGIEPVEQRRARPADMQIAGGRGRKARDDGLGHVAVSCYLAEGSGIIPGLVPGIQPSASCGASGTMDPATSAGMTAVVGGSCTTSRCGRLGACARICHIGGTGSRGPAWRRQQDTRA